ITICGDSILVSGFQEFSGFPLFFEGLSGFCYRTAKLGGAAFYALMGGRLAADLGDHIHAFHPHRHRPTRQTSTSAGPLHGACEPFEPSSMTSRISSGFIPRSTIAFLRAPATLTR